MTFPGENECRLTSAREFQRDSSVHLVGLRIAIPRKIECAARLGGAGQSLNFVRRKKGVTARVDLRFVAILTKRQLALNHNHPFVRGMEMRRYNVSRREPHQQIHAARGRIGVKLDASGPLGLALPMRPLGALEIDDGGLGRGLRARDCQQAQQQHNMR